LGRIYYCTCCCVFAVFISEVKSTGGVKGGREEERGREEDGFFEVEPPDVSVFLLGGEGNLREGGGGG